MATSSDRATSLRGLVSKISMAYGARVAGAICAFGGNVALGRTLGPEGAGLYFIALTVFFFASTAARLGLENITVKHASRLIAAEDRPHVRGLLQSVLSSAGIASLVLGGALFCFAEPIAILFETPGLEPHLRFMGIAIPLTTVLFLCAELLKGLGNSSLSVSLTTAAVPAFFLAFYLILGREHGVVGATASYLAATLLSAALAAALTWRAVRGGQRSHPMPPAAPLMREGFPLMLVLLVDLTINASGTLFLAGFVSEEAAGVFRIALRTAMLTGFIVFAINAVTGPHIARLYAAADLEGTARLYRRAISIGATCGVPVVLLFLVFPDQILAIFGPGFADGAGTLSIIAAAQLAALLCGPTAQMLIMAGEEKTFRTIALGAASLTLALAFVLIPPFGTTGAAIATAAGMLGQNLVAFGFIVFGLKINMFAAHSRTRFENSESEGFTRNE